jgi:hypothetical protein
MTETNGKDAMRADRASKGGAARMKKLSRVERQALASTAAKARWKKPKNQEVAESAGIEASRVTTVPKALYSGILKLGGTEIPVYVLSNGQKVLARIAATEALTGVKRQGDLESYIRVGSLREFIDMDSVLARMVIFGQDDVSMLNQTVKGLPSDLFIEICQSYVAALDASKNPESGVVLTDRQEEIAIKAGMFLSACAKVGLDALIDEATGYQYIRPEDALEIKLRLYLEEEMRKWEKTFPDQLWEQFGRLTNWKGKTNQRPKYWGKLVMELIYEYLDPDVAQWLRDNAPVPIKGQNYHQWMSGQYGLKRLIEHIWKVIGIANTCQDVEELRYQMANIFGKRGLQFQLKLVPVARTESNGA